MQGFILQEIWGILCVQFLNLCAKFWKCKQLKKKLRYFWWNPKDFWPSIDSKGTTTFKAQKGGKYIVKIVHVTSGVQL